MSLTRLLGVWLLLALMMSFNGIVRETVLRPALQGSADAVSAATGLVIILAVTAIAFRPAFRTVTTTELFRASFVLLLMTVTFEFAVGRFVDHKTWSELFANYAIWDGKLWPFLLLTVALSPFVWGRWFAQRQLP